MKYNVNVEKEYNKNADKAIDKFFKTHQELAYWKETLEWMNENEVDFFSDNRMADGTINEHWTYAIHLDKIEENYTYICILERA